VNQGKGDGTPLMLAIQEGKENSFEALIRHPDTKVTGRELAVAVLERRSGMLEALLKLDRVDINAVPESQCVNLLLMATMRGKLDAVQKLLAMPGIQVNQRTAGSAPLLAAASRGRLEIARALLAHPDIDVNAQDAHGWSALHLAVDRNELQMVELLLRAPGIETQAPNPHGRTPLERAIASRDDDMIELLGRGG
ncbi:MAG TPA: ankyrin repeat domain-containing protein, partial [Burkholderiaceae bacterium]|nr:ankyrin repeat domain-containing protein [Burkholderiaceae bacterium]